MNEPKDFHPPIRSWYRKKRFILPITFLFLLGGGGYLLYSNFNRLLSVALLKSFNQTLVSDVYELKFEDLYVNIIDGDIRVKNVVFQPRAEPLADYPYINSDFRLTTRTLRLKRVKVFELLREHRLQLERIEIDKPQVEMRLDGEINVLFPFNDSTAVKKTSGGKKALESLYLEKFQIIDASFYIINNFRKREMNIETLNFSINQVFFSQVEGMDSLKCGSLELAMDSVYGTFQQSSLRQFTLGRFSFSLEKFRMMKSLKILDYQFDNAGTLLSDLAIDMADSVFHVALDKLGIDYRERSITINGLRYEPNVSEAELRKRKKFQDTQFSCTSGSIELKGVNFDSLMKSKALFLDEMIVDSLSVSLYKDKTKPADPNRFPIYPGQQLGAINFPLRINKVSVKNGNILNRERKPDGTISKVTVASLNATVTNVCSRDSTGMLTVKGDGLLEGKVKFNASLDFDYEKPQFVMKASTGTFRLKDLNRLLLDYTPAKVDEGVVDGLLLEATAYHNKAVGTLKFLYHGLVMDLKLEDKAKWKSDLGAFAANSVLPSSNPVEKGMPPKIVKFEVERDMHKGFINIFLKSLITGLKESIYLTKDNRKNYNRKVKEWKKNEKEKD